MHNYPEAYDIIVVGGGHAGAEAAAAAATLGSRTLLITMNMETIGQMSCNPAMGGVAKGQIIREIDALGGRSGIITDHTMIQFRMLNRSKGAAMWSPRAQSDRMRFARMWRITLESIPLLDFMQDMVVDVCVDNEKVNGVVTQMGYRVKAKAVILTSGTFLNGVIHIGEKQFGGGRAGERASTGITESLVALGFDAGRMKTGTPPRVDGRTLDFSKMEEQQGDTAPGSFSYSDTPILTQQKSCYITYTAPDVHEVLASAFDKSPMFNGRIQGIGPRYCPSIEDKINRFADKNRHQLFVEPEGRDTVEMYINGFSSSLPEDVQMKALRLVSGFESAKFFRAGYAIEYDYFPPTQLHYTLETTRTSNLYFAGQINGTTGYEEAAAQGLIAGINAHLKLHNKDPFVLRRDQAYIGVLIDDLITKGTDEPYRMFTSRAEFRLLLRQDNADIRLTHIGHSLGLATEEAVRQLERKVNNTQRLTTYLDSTSAQPDQVNPLLESKGSAPISVATRWSRLLSRPQIQFEDLKTFEDISTFIQKENITPDATEQVEINTKYAGYIEKEKENAEKVARLHQLSIPIDFDYTRIGSLSSESKEKLIRIRPTNIGQAQSISGIKPSDINSIIIAMGR